MCMRRMKCRKGCPYGQILDPRESCSCVDQSVIDALYTCEPEKTEPELEHEIVCECGVGYHPIETDKTCEKGFRYDMDACKCMIEWNCKKGCGYGRRLDPTKFCTCIEESEYEKLLKKPDDYNEDCNIDYWGPPHPPKEESKKSEPEKCTLTKD